MRGITTVTTFVTGAAGFVGSVLLSQLNVNNGQGTTFGQLARGGFSDSLYLGFNLARKFF